MREVKKMPWVKVSEEREMVGLSNNKKKVDKRGKFSSQK